MAFSPRAGHHPGGDSGHGLRGVGCLDGHRPDDHGRGLDARNDGDTADDHHAAGLDDRSLFDNA
jgi:hypothetical protein